ncbi:AMP-binding protein [Shewanella psychropiezotolerans]|uniref:AMP-binding protein n=1 Tax=Shewanella psychropiezotolerans TaxID=2593655 RepID=A0ABX5X124_9GAMM|nr:AMP-binding protein [Shewanella psychropiezotolerans]QDO84841.1 AMP-binding protein [Shewanella psychropiezotolerans]
MNSMSDTLSAVDDLLQGFEPYPPSLARCYTEAQIWDNAPLWTILSQGAQHHADKVAIKDAVRELTYRQLLEQADGIAKRFQEDGLIMGDRVVIQLSNTCYFAIAFFAAQRAGLVPVMALPAHGLAEISHFVAVSQAKGYICERIPGSPESLAIADALSMSDNSLTHIYAIKHHGKYLDFHPSSQPGFTPPKVIPEHPALFLVSGGTTGLPKLIPRTHNDYLFNIQSCVEVSDITASDIYLAVLPAAHNFTLGCPGLLGALSKGGRVIFSTQAGPDHCFDLIENHSITATALVPALAQLWTEASEWETANLSSLRLMQVGGSKLAYSDALAIQTAFPKVLQQVFGMAEGLIACTRLGDAPAIIAAKQGRPVSKWDEIRIVDNAGNPVAIGEEGELLTRGPYTLRGYYRAPKHNQVAFTDDGFYRSGDKVSMNEDRYITVTGRIKDVINRAGESIATDEIEAHLLSHPEIAQVAVVPVADTHLGERIGVALVCKGEPLTLQNIRHFLKSKNLAAFKMPDELHLVHSLPKTAVGKIDKKSVPGPNGKPWMLNTYR